MSILHVLELWNFPRYQIESVTLLESTFLTCQMIWHDFLLWLWTVKTIKVYSSSSLFFSSSGKSHPLPVCHSLQHRLLKLACRVSNLDIVTSHTCQVDQRQSRAVPCFPPCSPSLSLPPCLSLSPLSVCRQDPVSLQPASQPDSYVGEPDWLSTERDVQSRLPRSSLYGSQLGGCMLWFSFEASLGDDWSNLLIFLRLCCWISPSEVPFETELPVWFAGGYRNDSMSSSVSALDSCSIFSDLLLRRLLQGQGLSDNPKLRI